MTLAVLPLTDPVVSRLTTQHSVGRGGRGHELAAVPSAAGAAPAGSIRRSLAPGTALLPAVSARAVAPTAGVVRRMPGSAAPDAVPAGVPRRNGNRSGQVHSTSFGHGLPVTTRPEVPVGTSASGGVGVSGARTAAGAPPRGSATAGPITATAVGGAAIARTAAMSTPSQPFQPPGSGSAPVTTGAAPGAAAPGIPAVAATPSGVAAPSLWRTLATPRSGSSDRSVTTAGSWPPAYSSVASMSAAPGSRSPLRPVAAPALRRSLLRADGAPRPLATGSPSRSEPVPVRQSAVTSPARLPGSLVAPAMRVAPPRGAGSATTAANVEDVVRRTLSGASGRGRSDSSENRHGRGSVATVTPMAGSAATYGHDQVIRREMTDVAPPLDQSSAGTPSATIERTAELATEPPRLGRWQFEDIVDTVIERIERRVVDELERRGRRHHPGVF